MRNAADVVQADLEYMHAALRDEWPALAGRRLLITGGAGFLGYYLAQAAVHFNRSAPQGRAHRVTVYDNLARGVPAWLEQLPSGRRARRSSDPRHAASRCRMDFGDFDYIIHAAVDRLADLLPRRIRSRRWTPTSTACATCSTTPASSRAARPPVRGFLFFSSSEIYGDPAPGRDPDARDLSRASSPAPGPRACYDESKRYGETLCVIFARQHGVPVQDRAPVQQLRPGSEDHRRPRAARLRARRARRPRHRDALRRLGDADLLLRRRRGHRLLQGAGPRARRRALQHRHRGARDLDARAGRAGGRGVGPPVRLHGARSCMQAAQDARLPGRQPEPPLPDHHQGARPARLRPADRVRRRARRSLLWYRDNQERSRSPGRRPRSPGTGAAA